MIIILANMYEVCCGGGQGHEEDDDDGLVLYATGLFNKFKSQSTLVSFQRLDAVIAELNNAVHMARRMVAGKTTGNVIEQVNQSPKPSGDRHEDMLAGQESPVEVFSHEVIQWGGEDGSELGVFTSLFGTEASKEMGDEMRHDESAWMGGEQSYIFEDVDFEQVVSVLGLSSSC